MTGNLQGTRLRLVTFLVTGALFMEVLDGNIIATALPDMGRSFGVSAVQLNVAISAYLLSLGVFIPVSGWIADRLGPRWVFSCAIGGFTLTSIACGMASDFHTFIAMRVLQGVSGALMVPVGRLVVLRYTPQSQRMAAMSNLVWPALVAPVIAPPLGGFIVNHASWHWIFFLNVPLGLAALVVALWLIPPLQPVARKPFDWAGFVLCGLGMFALLGALELLTTGFSVPNLVLLLVGAGLLAAAVRHFRRASSPMLDLSPLRLATFRAAMRGGSVSRMAIGSAPFLLPLMFQLGFGMDAFHSGLWLLVMFAGNLAMKAVTTQTLRRFGYRPVMLVNGLAAGLCLAAWALVGPATPAAVLVVLLFVSGMTRSMQFTCLATIAFADVPEQQMSDANGLFNVISQVSMAAGITLGAMAVRLGDVATSSLGWTVPAAEYKVAFVIAGVLTIAGLLDALRLPKGAGDHFVTRK